jgi:hypothetical protein
MCCTTNKGTFDLFQGPDEYTSSHLVENNRVPVHNHPPDKFWASGEVYIFIYMQHVSFLSANCLIWVLVIVNETVAVAKIRQLFELLYDTFFVADA